MIDPELRREIEHWKRELQLTMDCMRETLTELNGDAYKELSGYISRLERLELDLGKAIFDDDLAIIRSICRSEHKSAHA